MRTLIAAVAACVVCSAAQAEPQAVDLGKAAQRVGKARAATWECQDRLHMQRTRASVPVWGLPRSAEYRLWAAHRWSVRRQRCEAVLSQRTLPATNDWQTAVRIVQRLYPGTSSWMLYISDREGGYGPWVWYGGSHWHGYHIGHDTVGGWMQFRWTTFAPYWRAAQADVKRRGYIMPSLHMPPEGGPGMYVGWLNPLAQALTAGYMRYTGKDGCHWCL